ncbi:MAG: hypothetical protein IKA40_05630 [Clostridia bacterium]|nr:hypothetical protein [Clostridia bacterium]
MHVDKIIVRAALTTLAVVLMLCAFMVLALSFVFPSTMMQLTYDMGMNAVSVQYARRAYDYSGDVYYVAFATEVSILDGNIENVAEYGTLLITDDEFATYCEGRNAQKPPLVVGTYEQYVYGQVYSAEYVGLQTAAEKALVINKAFASIDGAGFPQGNAVATIVIAAKKKGDNETLRAIREKMNDVDKNSLAADDSARFADVFALTNG